jgi:hypothetical protein
MKQKMSDRYSMSDYSTHDKSAPPTPDFYTGAHVKAGYDPKKDKHLSNSSVKAAVNHLKKGG